MAASPSEALDRVLQAARKGDFAAVVECVEAIDCSTASNQYGLTPLHAAVSGGSEEVIRLLVERRAEIDKPDRSGFTPLYVALTRNRLACVKLLLELGASIEFRNQDGATALHVAASLGREEIAQLLIDEGADVNAKNNVGNTPAMAAAMAGRSKILELLLETGRVDATITSKSGQSVLDLAAASRAIPPTVLNQLRKPSACDGASAHLAEELTTAAERNNSVEMGVQTGPFASEGMEVSAQTAEAIADGTGPAPYLEQLAQHRRRIRKLERKLASAQDEVVRLRRLLDRQSTAAEQPPQSTRDARADECGSSQKPELSEASAVASALMSEYRLRILDDIERRLEKMQAGEILSARQSRRHVPL
ncbi:hypothetical protein FOZ60_011845 [Perkinsus olseni]|uniref:Uncharacterized protein n=1 Tax=Perkinsus olseni TaxID=32597 RepID=A0A7J6PMD4_PEROL|nr:hypothetical protein FOZ60_011845 [Perkinsus olseni]